MPTAGPSTGEAFGGVQCTAVRPQTEPDLMAWDSGSRATLRAVKEQGVVVVRYEAEGCNVQLHVLPNCVAKGSYAFSPYSATETKMARTANELFAELPVGAAKLAARLKGTHAIRTDYMMAGVESLKIGSTFKREELVGECADATHVVSKIYVGGFALAAGEASVLEGGVSVFVMPAMSVGGGARSESALEHLQHEGVATACEEAQRNGTPSPQCSVPLRVALMPLGTRKDTATALQCPAGAKWDGGKCVASVDTTCGSGLRFETGRGCVANTTVAATSSALPATAPATANEFWCNTEASLCWSGRADCEESLLPGSPYRCVKAAGAYCLRRGPVVALSGAPLHGPTITCHLLEKDCQYDSHRQYREPVTEACRFFLTPPSTP